MASHKLGSQDLSFLQDSLEKYKQKNTGLLNQLKHYEKNISNLEDKLTNIAQAELTKRQELMDRNKTLQRENEKLKEQVIHTQNLLNKLEKKNLR
jgi:septal ring factor EnvC (AmiA/AmiB activator)